MVYLHRCACALFLALAVVGASAQESRTVCVDHKLETKQPLQKVTLELSW